MNQSDKDLNFGDEFSLPSHCSWKESFPDKLLSLHILTAITVIITESALLTELRSTEKISDVLSEK